MEDAKAILKKIFVSNEKNQITNQLISQEAIQEFINYLSNDNVLLKTKVDLLTILKEKFMEYRMLIEYFSTINHKSIYIYLIEIYISEKNDNQLRDVILDFIDAIVINIEVGKEIFDYIYQKISLLYRGIDKITSDKMNNYLLLLKHLYGDTVNAQNPKNYFTCNGKGGFIVNLEHSQIKAGNSFSFILNFKTGMTTKDLEHLDDINYTANLITILFSNNKTFTVDLQYPMFIIVKSLRSGCIKSLPLDEWIVFVLTIHCVGSKLLFYIFVNGENHMNKNEIANFTIDTKTYVKEVSFFNGFIGEVTSLTMLSQKDNSHPVILNSSVLQLFRNYKEGLWKKKIIESFIKDLSQHKKTMEPQNIPKRSFYNNKKEEVVKYLSEDLVFIFAPYSTKKKVVEDVIGNCSAKFTEMIKLHRYKSNQKKILLLGGISNLLPIAEMLFLNQNVITENILTNYLSIISTILDNRKYNMRDVKMNSFFEIVSLFIEKYPAQCFSDKTLEALSQIGKVIFKETEDSIASVYFEHIFLNEKIISKFSQALQVLFWNQITLFCQSDKTQIETFVNMKKICLILRYYDEKKYSEMCCEDHYKQFKPEFAGGSTIMIPPMKSKLKDLSGIMSLIIDSQTPENAGTLFKLLTLDVSPCLAKFIINIFKFVFKKIKKEWINKLLTYLFNEKCEIIIANTFRHSLLDVRMDIIDFLFEMHKCVIASNNKSSFSKIEKMLKTCLLPEEMFYGQDKTLSVKLSDIKELALHCASSIQKKPKKSKCSQFKGDQIVFKEGDYQNYITSLFQKLLLWSMGKEIDFPFEKLKYDNEILKNTSIFEILLHFTDQLKDIKFTHNFLNTVNNLLLSSLNCYTIIQNEVIFSWLLNVTFNNFKNKEVYPYLIFELGKGMIINIIIHSIEHVKDYIKESKDFPIRQIETILTWGNKVRGETIINAQQQLVIEFIQTLFHEILTKINSLMTSSFDSNFPKGLELDFVKTNYLIFVTYLFNYFFYYKNEHTIQSKGYGFLCTNSFSIVLPEGYLCGMKIEQCTNKDIDKIWSDYPFFDDIMKKFSFIWGKDNSFKKKQFKKNMNKILKYEDILKNIILNKDKKNIYLEELKLLCAEKKGEDGTEVIIPLIRTIPITLANIILTAINIGKDEKQIDRWVKEFKNFMRFIIIASSNATLINQLELYTMIQEKCLYAIVFGICFLKDQYFNCNFGKDRLKKALSSILSFCMIIVKEQYIYIDSHNGLLKKLKRHARNDLSQCAVFKLFTEFVLDKSGQPLLTSAKISSYSISQFVSVVDALTKEEWRFALFDNQNLKTKLDLNFFGMNTYQLIVNRRYNNIPLLTNQTDESYKKEIFNIVQLYETELEKYSNNSIFGIKNKKNQYKKIKKHLFTWRGMWSDRELFYKNIDKLKVRILNHYTKNFARPCLIPILDIDYYLPNFTSFNTSNLFREKPVGKIILDMDQIFKSQTQNSTEQNEKAKIESNNYIRDIYRKSNSELSYAYLKISNKLDFGKDEEIVSLLQKNLNNSKNENTKGTISYYLCCLVKPSHHIKGVLYVTETGITFKVFLNQKSGNSLSGVEIFFKSTDEDYDTDRKTCFGSYFVWHHKDVDISSFSISFEQINFFFRKRYYYKNSGMEIFSKNNKSYFFNFKEEDNREIVINEILSHLKDPAKIIDDLKDPKDSFDNIVGYLNQYSPNKKRVKKLKLSKQIAKWTNWEISNFEMLMWLNFFSNRSYLDISQYPVMPWILSDYEDPLQKNTDTPDYQYRDFSLPMGMMELSPEGEIRKQTFIEIYDSMKTEGDASMKPYVYGSHYSNPVYVANYLTRLFPFSHIMIELQGNKFDAPDRMFLSVANSFRNSTTQKTDLRELIPEFFFLPEMFLNINKLNMGQKENKELVDDVFTPCNNNPYDFVLTLREVLEGDTVSMNIQKWIDLIFGYKNRGKEADAAYNVFTESSYEDQVDMKKEKEKACLYRMVEFGLTPEQVTAKEFPMKIKKELVSKNKELTDSNNTINLITCRSTFDKKGDNNYVIKAQILENDKILMFYSNNLINQIRVQDSYIDKVYRADSLKSINALQKKLLCKMSELFNYQTQKSNHIAFYGKGKYLIIGGFFDGKLILITMDSHLQLIEIPPFFDPSPVITIEIDKNEEYLFAGNSKGNINVLTINGNDLKLHKFISHSMASINSINCSNDLNLWATCSSDGYYYIYTLPACKLIRSVKIEDNKVGDHIFLVSCPLPCVVIISNEENNWEIFVYTLNGHLHRRQKELNSITSPIIMKNLNSTEFLAYVLKDKIYIRSLPYLYMEVTIDLTCEVSQIVLSENNTVLYGVSPDGMDITVIKVQGEETNVDNGQQMI